MMTHPDTRIADALIIVLIIDSCFAARGMIIIAFYDITLQTGIVISKVAFVSVSCELQI